MSAGAAAGWDRKDDGTHIAVPIAGRDLDEVRAWCSENCIGDFLIVLGRRVVFERRKTRRWPSWPSADCGGGQLGGRTARTHDSL